MGATLQYEKYYSHDKTEVERMFDFDVEDTKDDLISMHMQDYNMTEDEAYETLMYTGTIYELQSIRQVYPEVVENENVAVEILSKEHQKWGAAMMIRIKDGTSLVGGWCSC
jgi:hypothetical protein